MVLSQNQTNNNANKYIEYSAINNSSGKNIDFNGKTKKYYKRYNRDTSVQMQHHLKNNAKTVDLCRKACKTQIGVKFSFNSNQFV